MPLPVSAKQRQQIISCIKSGMGRDETASQACVTPGQVAAIKAHMTMGTYEESVGALIENEIATAVDMKFGLERDL